MRRGVRPVVAENEKMKRQPSSSGPVSGVSSGWAISAPIETCENNDIRAPKPVVP